MVVAILATLALAGTAFVVVMSQESKAASSTLYLAQAELAARSGLEHAIGVIDASLEKLEPQGGNPPDWLAVTPDGVLSYDSASSSYTFDKDEGDIDAGWHRYFEMAPPSLPLPTNPPCEQLADPTRWVSHYFVDADSDSVNDEQYGARLLSPVGTVPDHAMWGRLLDVRGQHPAAPSITFRRGQYAVCITDLDGKLHANIARWANDLGGDSASNPVDQEEFVRAVADDKVAGLADDERDRLAASSGPSDRQYTSISEIAHRAGVDPTATDRKYALERFFTAYPLKGTDVSLGDTTANPAYDPATRTSETTVTPAGLVPNAHVGRDLVFPDGLAYAILANTADTLTVAGDASARAPGTVWARTLRPAVNVNTAPEKLLAELLKPPMRLEDDAVEADSESDDKAEALAKLICERRPFADRHELEDIVFRATGSDGVEDLGDYHATLAADTHLTERQFNDILNSIAGVLTEEESAFDEPSATGGVPGVYSFDGWEPYQSGEVGPSQTWGDCSAADGTLADHAGTPATNVTWSTELKFDSRFFHIYVIGRGWNESEDENDPKSTPTGVKRLHAIYDSRPPGRIIWLRWNLSSRGSVTDM
jgi:hypothetical protein